jgi:hypothetical protein
VVKIKLLRGFMEANAAFLLARLDRVLAEDLARAEHD